jgi:hypothetical protein
MIKKKLEIRTRNEDILCIEEEINSTHIINLMNLLNSDPSRHLIIKLDNIIKGCFAYANLFREILHSTNRKITVICSGIINLSGLIPLIGNYHIDKLACHDMSFISDNRDYKKNYVEYACMEKFDLFIKEILFRNTLLFYDEILKLTKSVEVYTAKELMEFGIIDDIYCLYTDNKSNSSFADKIIQREAILERRNERDKLKCEGRLISTPIGLN